MSLLGLQAVNRALSYPDISGNDLSYTGSFWYIGFSTMECSWKPGSIGWLKPDLKLFVFLCNNSQSAHNRIANATLTSKYGEFFITNQNLSQKSCVSPFFPLWGGIHIPPMQYFFADRTFYAYILFYIKIFYIKSTY